MIKLYDCDVGVTIRGQNYTFTHVDSVSVEDPVRVRLVRGANAGNKIGLPFIEGNKDAKTITTSVIEIPASLHELLKDVFNKKERIDGWAISKENGSSKFWKNAILAQEPQQLNLDDSPESMNTALIFESFDVTDTLKD